MFDDPKPNSPVGDPNSINFGVIHYSLEHSDHQRPIIVPVIHETRWYTVTQDT